VLKETVLRALKPQRRWRNVQVRLEDTRHVRLISKPANRGYLFNRQRALCQQALRPIDTPLDHVSVRGSAK